MKRTVRLATPLTPIVAGLLAAAVAHAEPPPLPSAPPAAPPPPAATPAPTATAAPGATAATAATASPTTAAPPVATAAPDTTAPPVATAAPPPLPAYLQDLASGEQLLRQGDFVGAASVLARARQEAEHSGLLDPATFQRLENARITARSRVGGLRITADAGTAVEVDGAAVGTAPILGEILVAPGKHRIIARGALCLGTKDAGVREGDFANVSVPCRVGPTWRRPLLITSAVIGGVALLTGISALAASVGKQGDIDQIVASANGRGFAGPYDLQQMRSFENGRVSMLNVSITSFLIAGAGLAGAGILLFGVAPRRPAEPPKVGVTAAPGGATLWMRW